uniref:Uncharacterized protein n=1 Tax=Rhizophora mucronata TaxID=61149 RepID=A0A2P2N2S1_RHIMU
MKPEKNIMEIASKCIHKESVLRNRKKIAPF